MALNETKGSLCPLRGGRVCKSDMAAPLDGATHAQCQAPALNYKQHIRLHRHLAGAVLAYSYSYMPSAHLHAGEFNVNT